MEALGLIGPLASIGGGLAGMFGGGGASSVPQATPAYQPTGAPQADQGIKGGIGQLSSSTVPSALAVTNNLVNNPYVPNAQLGVDTASNLGMAAGNNQFLQGGNLVNTGNSVVPYAYSALNAGFDPQGNVYNQQFQQNTDQTRALLEARGIDSTPYGAGVEAQSNLNFNNAWEANTLARQGQGAQTANSLFNTQTGDVMAGTGLQGQGANTYATGATLPYNFFNTVGGNQLAALGQSQGLQQTPIQDYFQYLQATNAAAGTATQQQNANVAQNQVGFNQNQVLGQGIGAGLQGLQKGWQSFANNNNVGWGASNPGAAGSSYYGPVAA